MHFGKPTESVAWGSCPTNPKWMAGYGAGILAQAPAELSDLCDPAHITAYLVNLLQVGIALPPSFCKFGVMAVWTYYLRYSKMPFLWKLPKRSHVERLWDIHIKQVRRQDSGSDIAASLAARIAMVRP